MIHLKKILTKLSQTLLAGLLIAILSLFGLPLSSASATSNSPMHLADRGSLINSENYHLQEIEDCIPEEITRNNQDIGERVARALSEMGDDQLERAFDLTDNPELSNAEVKFERCLQAKGIIPQRQLENYQ